MKLNNEQPWMTNRPSEQDLMCLDGNCDNKVTHKFLIQNSFYIYRCDTHKNLYPLNNNNE